MNDMKNRMINVKERLGDKFAEKLGSMAETIGEQARGRCWLVGTYEPKITIELLQEDLENNKS